MKNIIYLSGPMTGIAEQNRGLFEKAEHFYLGAGYMPINPHRLPQQESYEAYLWVDLELIAMCADAIAMLPGWEKSPGARRELKAAIELKLQIVLFTER